MATKIGPKTVTQRDRSKNLVFCVDAANYRSYRGEPTTNILTYGYFPGTNTSSASTNWGHSGTQKWSYRDGSQEIPYKGLGLADPRVVTFAGVGTWNDSGSGYLNNSAGSIVSGQSHTISFWYRFTGGNFSQINSQGIRIDVDGGLNSSFDFTLSYPGDLEWHYYSKTATSASTSWTLNLYGSAFSGVSGGSYFELAAIQCEQKDHPTPFQRNDATTNERDESAGGVDQALQNISGVGATAMSLVGTYATFGQSLYKPTTRNVLATIDPNQGHIGGAYWDFDGSDECIVVPYTDGSELDLSRGTIISWFKTSSNHNGAIVGWGTAGTNNYGNIAVTYNWTGGYADESFAFNRYSGSTAYIQKYIRKGSNFYADGAWHCVAVTSHGGASDLGNIYIDGELMTVTTESNVGGAHPFMNLKPETQYLNIGRRPYSSGDAEFNGEIANAMIWSSTLTAKEIKDIYIAQKGRFGK